MYAKCQQGLKTVGMGSPFTSVEIIKDRKA